MLTISLPEDRDSLLAWAEEFAAQHPGCPLWPQLQAAVDSWEAETGEAWPYRQRAGADPLVTHPDIQKAVKLKRLL
jgi:hypothetical protein